jgi:hypothetical protein
MREMVEVKEVRKGEEERRESGKRKRREEEGRLVEVEVMY